MNELEKLETEHFRRQGFKQPEALVDLTKQLNHLVYSQAVPLQDVRQIRIGIFLMIDNTVLPEYVHFSKRKKAK
jgi:hypothetical protein